jgi:hypothetical protein
MRALLALLLALGLAAAPRRAVVERFTVSERQLNQLLRAELRGRERLGLESATLKLYAWNYVSTYAVVNFDQLERSHPGTIPVLLRVFLRGRRNLLVDFRFQSSGGTFTYTVEKAYFDNLKVPAGLVQSAIELLASRQPERFDVTRPLPLPLGIQRAWTGERVLYCER